MTTPVSGPAVEASGDQDDGSTPGRRVVFVAGPGRSGTSTFAGTLRQLGLHVPRPEVIADETNPKGFGEPQWVVDFHDQLLSRANVHVSDARPQAWFATGRLATQDAVRTQLTNWLRERFDESNELLIKDPRLAWFLGLWRVGAVRCGAAPCFVTMLRPPTEVVGSRQRAYGDQLGDINKTAAWVNMLLHTEHDTRGSQRMFIRYHDLLDDWTVATFRAGEDLDLKAVQQADPRDIRRVHDFIDPSLRRVNLTWDDVDVPRWLEDLAEATWRELKKLAEPGGDTLPVHQALDRLRNEYTQLYTEAEALAKSSTQAAARRATARAITLARQATEQSDPSGQLVGGAATWLDRRVPHKFRAAIPARLRQRARHIVSLVRKGTR